MTDRPDDDVRDDLTDDATPEVAEDSAPADEAGEATDAEAAKPARKKSKTKKKTKKKSSRKKTTKKVAAAKDDDDPAAEASASEDTPDTPDDAPGSEQTAEPEAEASGDEDAEPVSTDADADADADTDAEADGDDEAPRKKKRRRRRRRKSGAGDDAEATDEEGAESSDSEVDDEDAEAEASDDDGDGDDGGKKSRKSGRKSDKDKKDKKGGRKERSRGGVTEITSAPPEPVGDEVMIINDRAGDECRIAILEEGHLEELYVERETTATNVGNIYKGRVVNVEQAIQAAFIDYGQGANGFLHISDLHPKYFPGKETTEKVGKKTPRRERPAIQDALKRGQEVLVQVLKEGIGSKGPTLTSYLSIPGRLLVMMPDMGKVGVSRKVEDDDARREMKKILDAIDLPEEFGFILRTAGLGRTKTEIKRDVAYLTRLWKQIEKRIDKVGAPCPLYTESDIVIRTVRDVLRPSIKAIVVDSKSAYDRVSAFLRVVAPRSGPKVVHYVRSAPVFHAFGVERQIELIHSREVPLKSGGALVIDQTEALVAIDVNSGKSRSARDSETNAYRTNCEAVDEIARQLRLRDLGGLVVNDLIDMRHMRHRKAIEERFRQNLKRDRARTSISRVSEFGLVEMTRQRMRPSIKSGHWTDCPTCAGRGEIRTSESLGSDVTRHVALYLDQTRVDRLEIVVSPRVASVLLSRKRRELVRMEDETGKRIDVRVSDDIPMDRVDYYAYDERNADLDLHMFTPRKAPKLDDLEREADDWEASAGDETEVAETDGEGGGKRRRRRRRKPAPADATAIALSEGLEEELAAIEEEEAREAAEAAASGDRDGDGDEESGEGGRKRRRRRRRRRGRGGGEDGGAERGGADEGAETSEPTPEPEPLPPAEPMQVFKLARELEVTSKELMARAAELGIEVSNHMNRLEGEQVTAIRTSYAPPPPEPEPTPEPETGSSEGSDGGSESTEGDGESGGGRKRRRRRRGRGRGRGGESGEKRGDASLPPESTAEAKPASASKSSGKDDGTAAPASGGEDTPKKKPRRRALYGAGRRPVTRGTAAEAASKD